MVVILMIKKLRNIINELDERMEILNSNSYDEYLSTMRDFKINSIIDLE